MAHSQNMVVFRPILKDEGELMTTEEFEEAVRTGCFIDYDGHGAYASATAVSNVYVSPSDVFNVGCDPTYSHVMWYNR